MSATKIHEVKNLAVRERVEEGDRSIALEKVPGGWQITITHPEKAIHADGGTSKQFPEVYRVGSEKAAYERYVAYAQALGADVELGKDGVSVIARK